MQKKLFLGEPLETKFESFIGGLGNISKLILNIIFVSVASAFKSHTINKFRTLKKLLNFKFQYFFLIIDYLS